MILNDKKTNVSPNQSKTKTDKKKLELNYNIFKQLCMGERIASIDLWHSCFIMHQSHVNLCLTLTLRQSTINTRTQKSGTTKIKATSDQLGVRTWKCESFCINALFEYKNANAGSLSLSECEAMMSLLAIFRTKYPVSITNALLTATKDHCVCTSAHHQRLF